MTGTWWCRPLRGWKCRPSVRLLIMGAPAPSLSLEGKPVTPREWWPVTCCHVTAPPRAPHQPLQLLCPVEIVFLTTGR